MGDRGNSMNRYRFDARTGVVVGINAGICANRKKDNI